MSCSTRVSSSLRNSWPSCSVKEHTTTDTDGVHDKPPGSSRYLCCARRQLLKYRLQHAPHSLLPAPCVMLADSSCTQSPKQALDERMYHLYPRPNPLPPMLACCTPWSSPRVLARSSVSTDACGPNCMPRNSRCSARKMACEATCGSAP